VSAKAIDPPVSVAVAPTATTLATFDVGTTATLTVQVANLDAVQTLACTVQRRATLTSAFVDSTIGDLADVQPLGSACVDLDCGANAEIRIVGVASGAGLTATVCGRDKPRRP